MAPHDCRRLLLAQLHVAPLHPAAPLRTRPVAPPAAPAVSRAPDTAASPHHAASPDVAFARAPLAPRGSRAR